MEWYTTNRTSYIKCHWGQRKLLYSEIEFLTIASQYVDFNNTLCVYVGAAGGHHLPILGKLFDKLKFLLYDPAKFVINENEQFMIKTNKDGFFTDKKVDEVLKIANKREILFISDIRIEPSNVTCHADMLSQQRWAIMMNAKVMMFKYRLPYIDNDEKEFDTTMPDEKIKDKIIIPTMDDKLKKPYLYLDGKIYWQLYPPSYSTETRLIVIRQGDKFNMKYYDSKRYESQCLYFNEVDRIKTYHVGDSNLVKYHILGFDDGYDSVSEYYIISKYFETFMKEKTIEFSKILKLLYIIDKKLRNITRQNLIGKVDVTLNKYIERKYKMEEEEKNEKEKKKYKEKIDLLKKKIITYNELVKISYKNQIIAIKKGTILDKEDYIEQLKIKI